MIELTIKEMIESVPALKQINEKKMSARTAYKFARIIREVEYELQNFQQVRNRLMEQFGKKDENGELIIDNEGNVEIFSDKKFEFNKEVTDLMASKVKIDCEQIDLDDIADNEFSPSEIGNLFLFIKDKRDLRK